MEEMKERFEKGVLNRLDAGQIEQMFEGAGLREKQWEDCDASDVYAMLKYLRGVKELQGEPIWDELKAAIDEAEKADACWKISDEEIGDYMCCFPYAGYPKKLSKFVKEHVKDEFEQDEVINELIAEVLSWWQKDWNAGYIKMGSLC